MMHKAKRTLFFLLVLGCLCLKVPCLTSDTQLEDTLPHGEYHADVDTDLERNVNFEAIQQAFQNDGNEIFKRQVMLMTSSQPVNDDETCIDDDYVPSVLQSLQDFTFMDSPPDICGLITVKSLPIDVNVDTCVTTACFEIGSLDNSIRLGVYDLPADGIHLGKTIVGIKQCYVKQVDGNYINACASGSLYGQRICFQIAGQLNDVPVTLQPYLFNSNECQLSLRVPINGELCPGKAAVPNLNLPVVQKPWPTPNTDLGPILGFNPKDDFCGKVWTTLTTKYDPSTCSTEVCLIPEMYASTLSTTFDQHINGSRLEWNIVTSKVNCPSNNPACSAPPSSNCVRLTGAFSLFLWNSVHTSRSTTECQSKVWLYALMKACPDPSTSSIDTGTATCSYPSTVDETACGSCKATCRIGNTYAMGTQTCTKAALNSRTDPFVQCKSNSASLALRSCYKPCPVDCSTAGVYWMECPANCYTPTATQTGFWSTITPALNGGRTCDNTITTKPCSVDVYQGKCSFLKDCKVAGIPEVDCASYCTNNLSRFRTVSATYPITVNTASSGGSSCPTFTTVCDCSNCLLSPTPVRVASTCDATCTSNDGGFVTGTQLFTFDVKRSASYLYPCTSVRPMSCSKSCSCSYTSFSTLGSCFATRTGTTKLPWTGVGYQKVSAIGINDACKTILDQICTTTYAPTNCVSECSACPTFNCKQTSGPSYETNTMLPCVYKSQGAYGGNTCNTKNTYTTCSTMCPGCDYVSNNCGCLATSSSMSDPYSFYFGYKTCMTNFITTPGMNTALCSPSKMIEYPRTKCTVTRNTRACAFTQASCEAYCSYVSTNSAKLPWSAMGFATCTLTDGRPVASKPKTCTTSSLATVSCTRTLSPVDCVMTDVCPATQFTCTDSIASTGKFVVTCQKITVRKSQYGGFPCPSATPYLSTTRAQCVRPTPSSYSPFDLVGAYNLIVFNDAVFDRGSVDGRVAIGGSANLTNFDVGKMISPVLESCSNDPVQAMIVGKNLFHYGTVKNGEVLVGGLCSNGTITSCPIICGALGQSCASLPIDFNDAFGLSDSLSHFFQNFSSTASFFPQSNNTALVSWSGSHFEVLNLDPSFTNPMYSFKSYQETRDSTGFLLINVFGTKVTLTGLNMEIFQPYAQNILWNFPQATDVSVNAMTLYGSILAPYAVVHGSGILVGQVVASSVVGSKLESLSFKYVTLNNPLLREFIVSSL